MAAWVHNVLVDSFLIAYQYYGPKPLTVSEADQFVAEQTKLGALLGSNPLPETADELHDWVTNHPDLAASPAMDETIRFLRNPGGLAASTRAGYWALLDRVRRNGAGQPPGPPRDLFVARQRVSGPPSGTAASLGAWFLTVLESCLATNRPPHPSRLIPRPTDPGSAEPGVAGQELYGYAARRARWLPRWSTDDRTKNPVRESLG